MRKQTLYLFAFSFILFLIAAVIQRKSISDMSNYTMSVDKTQNIITSLEALNNQFKSAQIYSPRFEVIAENFYNLYRMDAEKIPDELIELRELLKEDPVQLKRLDSLENLINTHLDALFAKNIYEIIQAEEAWRLAYLFKISATINLMVEYEERLLTNRQRDLQNSLRWSNILSTLFTVMAGSIIIGIFIFTMLLSKKRNWLEGFLESILNTSQNGIISFIAIREKDEIVDFEIEYANRAIENLLGFKPKQVTGKRLSEFTTQLDDNSMERYKEVVETGDMMEYENSIKVGDDIRWFFIRLARREDGVTSTFHEITTLKKSEEELKQSVEELAKSNAELEQYAYVASHDLQEPLRKIQTFGNLLWERNHENLDEKGKQQLQKILSSSARMSTLIKDILGYSSLRDQPEFERTSLNEELQLVLQDLDLLITQRRAIIKTAGLPTIDAIPLQMHQLFFNLLNNALKFVPAERKPLIEIKCRSIPAEEIKAREDLVNDTKYYEIEVADNGIGFNNSHAEQIFGLFKRLHPKDSYGGSGIGLALCYKVVQNHNGVIFAEGEEDKGARFHVILPAQQLQQSPPITYEASSTN
ncbi:MAG: sensor histidine kinase [Chitinophagaceae bacterium]